MGEAPHLSAWLQAHVARIPEAVRHRLAPTRDGLVSEALPDALAQQARGALDQALEGAGAHRGAFHLLAADGLATMACQAALLDPDPDGTLVEVLNRLLA